MIDQKMKDDFKKEAHQTLVKILNGLGERAIDGPYGDRLEAAKLYIATVMTHPYYMGLGDDEDDACSFE